MNTCGLLLVKTSPTRLMQNTTPAVLSAQTKATALIQTTAPVVLAEQTKPTLLLQTKGGPAGPPGPPGSSKPIISRNITSDLTVLAGTTCLHNQTRIAAGVSVRIEATGRLYIL